MNASDLFIQKALDHLTGISVWTPPATLHLALLKTAPDRSDSTVDDAAKELEEGSTIAAPVNGYSRKVITLLAAAGDPPVSLSDLLLTYGPSTTGWSAAGWGWIVDSDVGGAGGIWLQGALLRSLTAGPTDSILYAIGEVIFKLA